MAQSDPPRAERGSSGGERYSFGGSLRAAKNPPWHDSCCTDDMKTPSPPVSPTSGDLPVSPPREWLSERPPRILLAEDDGELRQLVLESLRKDGYDVVEVADGSQLLIRITDHYRLKPTPDPIDLIVTDIRMPVVSGLDIVRGLRDAHWTTPVVLITAFADSETHTRAKELGAVLLDKPFKMASLRSSVWDLLHPSTGAGRDAGGES